MNHLTRTIVPLVLVAGCGPALPEGPAAAPPAGAPHATAPLAPAAAEDAFRGAAPGGATTRGTVLLGGHALEASYSLIDGVAVTEGDILLAPGQLLAASARPPGTYAVGQREAAARWPGGVVPYTIDSGMPDQRRVMDAIAHWETVSSIRFVPRGDEADYVRFRAGSGCSSYVGRIGGEQVITLDAGCSTGNAMHEIGHAVGLWHQQSSPNRDRYVRIRSENIQPGYEHNFDQVGGNALDFGSYDFDSLMHYPATAFSRNGQPTIERIDGGPISGQRSGLSLGDRRGVEQMYGAFAFSYAGPLSGRTCVQLDEAADPHTWDDNYLCTDRNYGLRWSNSGPIAGMVCTQILEPSDPHTWNDNYLCLPPGSPFALQWSSGGPIAGMKCTQIYEPADPDTWDDNFLCYSDRRVAWSSTGPIPGRSCLQINEPSDPDAWDDNFLCTDRNYGLRWSYAGPIAGMLCTRFDEGADPHAWDDNYLCSPRGGELRTSFSNSGPIPGRSCIQLLEAADPHTWNDNYLCF